MPVYVTMERDLDEKEKAAYKGKGEPPSTISTRVVKSAFEKVWSKQNWRLAKDPKENLTAGQADDSTLDNPQAGDPPPGDPQDTGSSEVGPKHGSTPTVSGKPNAPQLGKPAE